MPHIARWCRSAHLATTGPWGSRSHTSLCSMVMWKPNPSNTARSAANTAAFTYSLSDRASFSPTRRTIKPSYRSTPVSKPLSFSARAIRRRDSASSNWRRCEKRLTSSFSRPAQCRFASCRRSPSTKEWASRAVLMCTRSVTSFCMNTPPPVLSRLRAAEINRFAASVEQPACLATTDRADLLFVATSLSEGHSRPASSSP
mmetsp:Transcript_23457/g.57883  ORF Transcript_23457/g.57883 Transcript_23457/m.57883 type:complete len:201 (+) Transcript_23457:337-939(+)